MRALITLLVVIATIILVAEATHWTHAKPRDDHHQTLARRAGTRRCKKKNPKPVGATAQASSQNSPAKGTIQVKSTCGDPGATPTTSPTSGPNGSLDWLTCGVNGGGWRPPFIRVQDLVFTPLTEAIKSPNSAFKACAPFIQTFEQIGQQFGVPSVLLASFAMQESGCKPGTVGGAGEQGLMQITREKCAGAPGGNCQDPYFNIRTGAQFFVDTVKGNGGNVLAAIGRYNGWFPGMTVGAATAVQYSCCRCQQNLDYLHQFVNGWLQNINAYSSGMPLGKFFNLNRCP